MFDFHAAVGASESLIYKCFLINLHFSLKIDYTEVRNLYKEISVDLEEHYGIRINLNAI